MLLPNLQKKRWISWLVGYRRRRRRGASLVGEGLLMRMIKLIILMIGIECSIRSWIDRMASIRPTSRQHCKWPTTQNDPTTNKYYNISSITYTMNQNIRTYAYIYAYILGNIRERSQTQLILVFIPSMQLRQLLMHFHFSLSFKLPTA